MARVQYGAMITEIKGSIGGSVFQGGNNSKVLRNKGYRKGTSSNGRVTAGRVMTSQTMRWRALSSGDKATWDTAALSWAFIDSFGNTYYGSGYQCFTAYNSGLLQIGEAVVDTPNTPSTNETLIFNDPGYSLSSSLVVGIDSLSTDSQIVQVFASPPMSAGRNMNNARFSWIGQFDSSIADEFNSGIVYESLFGLPPEGAQVVFKTQVRNVLYPRIFQTWTGSCIVTA